ncbi:hypothetical protein NC656_09330 [Pseudomonas asiatica]|uniref:hypothetical protein n=1 Tax=Pseudomonas asiatica TaxID=2219225 RepID=UPI00209BCD90|nr:hypothetical protein [Pseudomonas asiatica]MCO8261749.1 hypothetical protein [Pseudomonas asiatica]
MSPKLNLIARQVHRREEAPAPVPEASGGVGNAIEQMIVAEVDRRVGEALAEQRRQLEAQQPKPRYDSFAQVPPVPQTRAPKAIETQFVRDELGRVNRITVGTMEFHVQRNQRGQAVRIVPADTAPLPPPVPPADFNRAV